MLLLKPHQLTILSTSRCTARCAHCSMNSAPGRRERLRLEQITTAISELHHLNGLRVVIFAGGEPTLMGEDLLDAIAHAASLGIMTRIVTNAYWAVSPRRAREKLVELREAGLAELNLSADDYHLPYIPFERVETAWHASKGLGFQAVVIANSSGPKSVVNPRFIMDRLGEELTMRFDDDGFPQPLGGPGPDGTVYAIFNPTVQRLGRSNLELGEDEFAYPADQESLDGACPWAVRSAALSPKNHLVACCGIEAEHNEVLDFGDATREPLGELVARADDDLVVNAIALRGPLFLKRFVERYAPEVEFRERYASICEICEHVVRRPEVLAVLRRHTAELAHEVMPVRLELEDRELSALEVVA